MRLTLVVITTIYLIMIGIQDLKQRAIDTFPGVILIGLWCIDEAWNMSMSYYYFLWFMLVNMFVAVVFSLKGIWGAGDSYILILFAILYYSFINEIFDFDYICNYVLLFAVSLLASLLIAMVEARFKRIKLNRNSSIAVASGFAVVMIVLMWNGVIGC